MRRPIYRRTYLLTADGLADDAPESSSQSVDPIAQQQQTMKRAMIETAVLVAAVQVGNSILLGTLALVVPIGTIISAIIALIQMFTAPYVKREVHGLIANGVDEIKRKIAALKAEMEVKASDVAASEWNAAQALAASNEPLGSWIADVFRDIAKPIAKPFARIHTAPVKLIGQGVLNAALAASRAVGYEHGEEAIQHEKKVWAEKSAYFEKTSTQMAGDPIALQRYLHEEPMKYLVGTKQIETARKKIRSLVATVDTELAKQRPASLAQLDSPEYRTAVRRQLAGQIRQDPTALAKARDAVRIQQQAQNTLDQATAGFDGGASANASVAQADKVASTGGLLSFAAIVGYFLLHK